MSMTPNKFAYVPKTMKNTTPPQYARVTEGLSDAELDDELQAERGTDEWREAVKAEKQKRGSR